MFLLPSRKYQSIFRRYLPLVIGLALAFSLTVSVACSDDDDGGDGDPQGTNANGSAPAEDPGDQATPVDTQDLDPATGLPRTFPPEFPVYTGAEVFRASEHQDRYVIEWRTSDPIADVVAYYETGLAEAPWQLDASNEVDGVTTIDFAGEAGRQYSGSLAVAELTGKTRVFLNLNFEE
jgi:hypothetical protein